MLISVRGHRDAGVMCLICLWLYKLSGRRSLSFQSPYPSFLLVLPSVPEAHVCSAERSGCGTKANTGKVLLLQLRRRGTAGSGGNLLTLTPHIFILKQAVAPMKLPTMPPLCPQLLTLPPALLQHKRVCSCEVKGLGRWIGEETGCVSLALISVPGGVPCSCTRARAGTEGGWVLDGWFSSSSRGRQLNIFVKLWPQPPCQAKVPWKHCFSLVRRTSNCGPFCLKQERRNFPLLVHSVYFY